MKKLVLVLAVAGFAVACNSSSEKKEEKKDTVVTPIDTAATMQVDTMHNTTGAAVDTSKH